MIRGVGTAVLLVYASTWGAATAQVPVQPPRDAQTAAPIGTSTISGVVATADGMRIARAIVSIANGRDIIRAVPSDANGAFSLTQLPSGTYDLYATMPSFLTAHFGQTKPGRPGTPLRLAEGQTLRDVQLTLVRGGVISGTVYDPTGQPAWGALVRVLRRTWAPIGTRLQASNEIRVDDRGQYRITGLTPGEYFVQADGQFAPQYQSGGDRLVSTMFPSSILSDLATPVLVAPAEERGGTDIRLQLAPQVTLRGRVVGARGPASVWISPVDSAFEAGVSGKATDAQGRFEYSNLVPGRYRLGASDVPLTMSSNPDPASPDRQWANAEISLGADGISDLTLTLAPGAVLNGRLAFEGAGRPSRLPPVRLFAFPGSTPMPYQVDLVGRPDEAGHFTIDSVPAGRYGLDFGLPAGWRAKSAISNGQDLFDTMLDVAGGTHEVVITVTDRPSEIRVNLNGTPRWVGAYVVVAFAADSRFWAPGTRRVVAGTSADGGFLFTGLPPGDYLLGVLEDGEYGIWFDPRVLESLRPKAERITLTDGQRLVKDLIVR